MLELRQVVAVLAKHLVDHGADLGQREHGRGQRVVGDGLEHQARVAGQRRLDRHLLDHHAEVVERHALRRQRADMDRAEAVAVDVDRHLDAGALGQVGDQAGVGHVAVEPEDLAAVQRVDDGGGVLVPALKLDRRIVGEPLPRFVAPIGLPSQVLVEDVGIRAGVPAGAG